MRKVLMLVFCCLCSGCVYLDQTMLDTAEPLKYGKPKFLFYRGDGLNLDSVVKTDSVLSDEESKPGAGAITGLKCGIGLGQDYELGFRTWDGEGRGYGLNLKKRFYHHKELSLSINPFVYNLERNEDDKRQAYGWKVPVLFSARFDPRLVYTAQLDYSTDYYQITNRDDLTDETTVKGPYTIRHGGITGGFNLKFNKFCLYGELGGELVKGYHTPVSTLAIWGGGIGLEF